MKRNTRRVSDHLFIHRRLVAALSAGACVLALASVFQGSSQPSATVVTAKTGIAAGSPVTADQLTLSTVPEAIVPDEAISSIAEAIGGMTAVALPAGAILTASSFADASTLAAGHVMIPLPVSAQLLSAISPGSFVSVFLHDTAGGVRVTRGVRVVTVPNQAAASAFASGSDDVILVEVPEDLAALIAAGMSSGGVSVALE